jgi:hypothetical protein
MGQARSRGLGDEITFETASIDEALSRVEPKATRDIETLEANGRGKTEIDVESEPRSRLISLDGPSSREGQR